MGSEGRQINPQIVEKLTSDSNSLKTLLDLGDEVIDIQTDAENLVINFVLCDVVIENILCSRINAGEARNKIIIYFKPLCELGKELSSISKKQGQQVDANKILVEKGFVEAIARLLKIENQRKQELQQNDNLIEETKFKLEEQQREKSIFETKINQSMNILKKLPKKLINKKVILENRAALISLQNKITEINTAISDNSHLLGHLLQLRANLEAEVNKSIDEMLDIIAANYTIDKIEAL